MRHLFIAVRLAAAYGMGSNRGEEQDEEQGRKRVLVRRQDPAAATYRPRRVWAVGCLAGVLVLRGRLVNRLRLRGSTLEQEGGQHDVHRHLEKLALPVLERRLVEFATQQV